MSSKTQFRIKMALYAAVLILAELLPVSYTHLDVYKRQGLRFTGRPDIWDKAIKLFLESPFLGYGIAQSGKVYRISKGKYYHAHNAILEVLVEGGVFSAIAFVMMLERAGRQLLIYRRHPYACLLSAGLMSCALMTWMEPFLDSNGLLIYGLVFLSYHVGTLIHGTETAPAGSR